MTSQEIRQQFIDFFVKQHAHTFVPSSPVVPLDDPTLLFTNAGMNQFKPIFLGQEKRAYTRAANTQKCIRAGGKHNDLDDVGRSRRHHTFFEMLGNWSFGDYFKKGAIEMAWELLTKVWKLDPTRLHVSCYEGNPAANIPRDTEAADLWKKIANLPDDHIHYFGKDNFWEMGDTGPCGPCTEIYIDRTPDKSGGPQVNGEDPRVMEIWNLVFIQYNRDANGVLTPLPAQHVDTGMGLERICQVIQEKSDNYATDLWTPLFNKITEISNLKYTGLFPKTNAADPVAEAANEQLRHDIAFRVIADHVRCLTFALTDGAVPSNEGRGYVLRRILRRAVRFGRQQLNLHEPFMHKLVPVIVETMSGAFPELKKNPQHVIELIKDEEIGFGKTLDRGIELFEKIVRDFEAISKGDYYLDDRTGAIPDAAINKTWIDPDTLKIYLAAGEGVIPGAAAFRLHDTYGFPIDLTRIMAEERGMTVDIAGYEKLMERAKDLARSGGKETATKKLSELPPSAISQLQQANVKPTDDRPKFSHEKIESSVMAIWNGEDLGLSPASAFEDEQIAIILDRTNFYSEMGGQVGDKGVLSDGQMSFDVTETKAVGGYVLHIGRILIGNVAVGKKLTAHVQGGRNSTEKNHTSTHLANWALREVLGEGVQQKGSLVDHEKLRFDFSYGKAMTDDEIAKVEELVKREIARKHAVYAEEAPQDQALKINGLRAVFGEKYPPMVRVVSIGMPVKDLLADPANPKWREYSIEFCGGTHLKNSEEANAFVIESESAVSKGIRRITAKTGQQALGALGVAEKIAAIFDEITGAPDDQIESYIEKLTSDNTRAAPLLWRRRAQAKVAELQIRAKAIAKSSKSDASLGNPDSLIVALTLFNAALNIGPGKLIIGEIPSATDDQLRSAIDSLKTKSPSYAILLAAATGEKVTFIAAVSDDLITKGLKAGDWVKETAKTAGGSGGGRPNMAQAGAKDPTKLPDSLKAALAYAQKSV
jgi:alanyl-tRNA synthetase